MRAILAFEELRSRSRSVAVDHSFTQRFPPNDVWRYFARSSLLPTARIDIDKGDEAWQQWLGVELEKLAGGETCLISVGELAREPWMHVAFDRTESIVAFWRAANYPDMILAWLRSEQFLSVQEEEWTYDLFTATFSAVM